MAKAKAKPKLMVNDKRRLEKKPDAIDKLLHPERFVEEIPKRKKLVPIADRIVVTRDTAEEMTKGGLIIPEVSKDKPQAGTIIEVGPDCKTGLKVNEKVLFGKYSGTDITLSERTVVIMLETEVLGRVVDAE